VGLAVDEVALGQVLSEYLDFRCELSFTSTLQSFSSHPPMKCCIVFLDQWSSILGTHISYAYAKTS
jgi:hypothetical protein